MSKNYTRQILQGSGQFVVPAGVTGLRITNVPTRLFGSFGFGFIGRNGRAYVAGDNSSGQLALGNTTNVNVPTLVPEVVSTSHQKKVSIGFAHALYLGQGGVVGSSGENGLGQLGDGTTTDRTSKVGVINTSDELIEADDVFAGEDVSFAIKDGFVYAWGNNTDGQLGLGSLVLTPTKANAVSFPTALGSIISISNQGIFTLALGIDGKTYASGQSTNGEFGNGGDVQTSNTFVEHGFTQIGPAKQIAAGNMSAHMLLRNGEVWCCGDNTNGQLGDGTNLKSNTPIMITDHLFKNISAGLAHVLAISKDGYLYSWGANGDGQLGQGDTTDRNTPALVSTSHKFIDIAAAGNSSFALREDGKLFAWGSGEDGRLGLGNSSDYNVPTQVSGDYIAPQTKTESHMMIVEPGQHIAYNLDVDRFQTFGPIVLPFESTSQAIAVEYFS